MAIKTILVPLDESKESDSALHSALVLAKRFGAHIEVLSVIEREDRIISLMSDTTTGAAIDVALEAVRHRINIQIKRTRARFEAFRKRSRLTAAAKPARRNNPSISLREEKGGFAAWIGLRGRVSDLIVLPRPQGNWGDNAPVEAALLRTGRLVLVVPGPVKALGRKIAIGWNGSAEAARAVAAAMPFLESASQVTVLGSKGGADSRLGIKELSAYLAWHGIKAKAATFSEGSRSTGKVLLAQADKADADLLVIGGYSHSRQRELIFGGVTRHVLSSARIPVLLLH